MCGICGIWNLDGRPVERESIERMNSSIRHRGPDGDGYFFSHDKSLSLGHRRLSILDLTANGAQPMPDKSGRYTITFNGEIYNFLELRKELSAKGHQFYTESDTEVILAAYREWGEEMLHRFNGMWAFAIYDLEEESLFLARDRYGIKPLYYYHDGKQLLFASEVKAIETILEKRAEADTDVLRDLSTADFFYHGTNKTYLKNVRMLPGGNKITVKKRWWELKPWYKLQPREVPSSFEEQAEAFLPLLISACKLRLRSDVPLATCLSGGLDSGSITSLIHHFGQDNEENRFNHFSHQSFLASFPNTVIDERIEAEKLAKLMGNKLEVVEVHTPSIAELEESMQACDGPMPALAFYPIWKLYQFIRSRNIKVTLDGQGPDEMLGGYRPIYPALRSAFDAHKYGWAVDIYRTYASQGKTKQFSSVAYANRAVLQLMKETIKGTLHEQRKPIYKTKKYPLIPSRREKPFNSIIENDLYSQFFTNPLPGILNQFDRCSMASGVECRMPFMDYRVVEYVFSLPIESKIGGGYTKRILRESLKGILPEYTRLNKKKIGFNAPIVEWYKGALREFMRDAMADKKFNDNPFFNGPAIRKSFEEFLKKESPEFDEAFKFWPSVHIIWWLNKNKVSY